MKARHITAQPEMGRLGPIGQRDTDTVAVGCRNRNSETTTKRAAFPFFKQKDSIVEIFHVTPLSVLKSVLWGYDVVAKSEANKYLGSTVNI